MTKTEEIQARLDAHNDPHKVGLKYWSHRQKRDGIAFLLEEKKRLTGIVAQIDRILWKHRHDKVESEGIRQIMTVIYTEFEKEDK